MNFKPHSHVRTTRLVKQIALILMISLVGLLVLTSSFNPTAAQGDKNNLTVRLKSREFVPAPGVEREVQRQQNNSSPDKRIHVLMQFDHIPSATERAALKNTGVELLAYVPDNAWFVSIPAGLNLQGAAGNNVRWIGAIQANDRTAPSLRSRTISQHAVNDDGTYRLDVRFFSDVTDAQAKQLLAKYSAVIETEAPEFHRFTIHLNSQLISSLAGEDAVQWITEAVPPKTIANDGIRARTNVGALQSAPYNLSGNQVDLGEWDGGRVDNHADFSGRLTYGDFTGSIDDHATHVAGTMAGDGSSSASQGGTALQWRGMAPNANIISYYWDNNLTDHNDAINIHSIELSQNSWGYTVAQAFGNCDEYGDYDDDAPDYDRIITGLYGKRISVVFAAGNERDDGDCGMSSFSPYLNYANLGPPGTAKNMITVGATNSNDDTMTSFSSWGPVDDGRIKPEVVAPGCESSGEGYIHSTLPGGIYGGMGWCGTSMAAPSASGIMALLTEQYRTTFGADPLPSTLKAILVQSAVDLNNGTSYLNPGPDYASGYGRIDAQAAVDLIIDQTVFEDQVSHSQVNTYTFNVPANTPMTKVTLAWDDEPGTVNANPALVNNLDLVLVEPNGATTHLPWVLDPLNPANNATTGVDSRNNVEQVQVNNPISGTWQIRVNGTNIPTILQNYSLVTQFLSQPSQGGSIPRYYLPLILKSTGTPSGPTPGYWTSLTGDEFYVTPDKANVADFAVKISVSGCGKYKITHLPSESIIDNQFSFDGSFYASGTFDTATTANGIDGLNNLNIPGCGLVSGGPWAWTASWQDSSQPTVVSAEVVGPEILEPITGTGKSVITVTPVK